MPSSVREGTRPSADRMRLYSSGVMACCANNSGVTAAGSGMTAEEAIVITIASIVARHSQSVIWKGVWKARVQFKCRAQEALAATRDRVWKGVERGRVEFVASQVPKAGSFDRL